MNKEFTEYLDTQVENKKKVQEILKSNDIKEAIELNNQANKEISEHLRNKNKLKLMKLGYKNDLLTQLKYKNEKRERKNERNNRSVDIGKMNRDEVYFNNFYTETKI